MDTRTLDLDAGTLLDLEERFWKGDADYFRDHLAEDSLMVLPEPVGMQMRDETIEAMEEAPRWIDVHLDDAHVVRLADDAAILTYTASARHDGDADVYVAFASSAYVNRDGAWKLAFHQQTPGGV